jgi:hypothetical protein
MLQITPASAVHPRKHRFPILITGQSLTKGKRGPRQRARLAANWVLGSLLIAPPTVALAARTFDVSQPLVNQEINELKATTVAHPAVDTMWSAMTDDERDAFVVMHLGELWDRFEHVTDARLETVAA